MSTLEGLLVKLRLTVAQMGLCKRIHASGHQASGVVDRLGPMLDIFQALNPKPYNPKP